MMRQSMLDRTRLFLASIAALLCLSASLSAQVRLTLNVNCTRNEPLALIAANAPDNTIINVKGTCPGPVNISASGLQIRASGTAGIDGGGKDAVAINGAQRVTLSGLTITGGNNGVVLQNAAQVTLANDTVSANKLSGIVALGNSSVTVTGGSSQGNSVHG